MPITYNIKTDGLYLKGKKEGIEKGIEQGKILTAKNLLKEDISIEKIAQITGLTVEKILFLKNEE